MAILKNQPGKMQSAIKRDFRPQKGTEAVRGTAYGRKSKETRAVKDSKQGGG